MKRFLLLVSAMLVMTSVIAQNFDVYASGSYTQDGQKHAVVFKNNEKIHDICNGSSDNISTSVVVDESTNDVYWVRNNDVYGDVYKNSAVFLNNVSNTHVNDLCYSNYVFAAGYKDVSGVQTAVLWRGSDTTPLYTYGDGTHESEATCVILAAGMAYVGGYMYTSSSEYHGVVWYSGSPVMTLSANTKIYDIAYYNNELYAVGTEVVGKATHLKVWKDGNEMYTLTESGSGRASICIYGGDVYVAGYDGSPDKVWKNGEDIYSTSQYFKGVTVNSEGIFCAGGTKIYLDGVEYIAPSGIEMFNAIYVTTECTDSDVRTLPYTEDFAMGATDWTCWTVTDEGQNSTYNSKWCLEDQLYEGDYNAFHRWNSDAAQEGWLISPRISLNGVTTAELSFNTREAWAEDYTYEGVWVSTTGTNPSNFQEVWTQSNPMDSWYYVSIDLSAFAGQNIYVAFKYTGQDGHGWYVDDIYINGNLSVGENSLDAVAVYPNPANDVLYIRGLENTTEVSIYNAVGVLVKVVNVNDNESINISELSSGLYIAKFGDNVVRFTKE